MAYSLEVMAEIWDDASGGCLEVGPDRDGLGMVELRSVSSDGAIITRITIEAEVVPLLIQGLTVVLKAMKPDEK